MQSIVPCFDNIYCNLKICLVQWGEVLTVCISEVKIVSWTIKPLIMTRRWRLNYWFRMAWSQLGGQGSMWNKLPSWEPACYKRQYTTICSSKHGYNSGKQQIRSNSRMNIHIHFLLMTIDRWGSASLDGSTDGVCIKLKKLTHLAL